MTRLEEEDLAAALVQRGMQLDPTCTDGYLVSAYLMEDTRRPDNAIPFHGKVLILAPGDAEIWIELGNAYWHLADEVAARRVYARAVAGE